MFAENYFSRIFAVLRRPCFPYAFGSVWNPRLSGTGGGGGERWTKQFARIFFFSLIKRVILVSSFSKISSCPHPLRNRFLIWKKSNVDRYQELLWMCPFDENVLKKYHVWSFSLYAWVRDVYLGPDLRIRAVASEAWGALGCHPASLCAVSTHGTR